MRCFHNRISLYARRESSGIEMNNEPSPMRPVYSPPTRNSVALSQGPFSGGANSDVAQYNLAHGRAVAIHCLPELPSFRSTLESRPSASIEESLPAYGENLPPAYSRYDQREKKEDPETRARLFFKYGFRTSTFRIFLSFESLMPTKCFPYYGSVGLSCLLHLVVPNLILRRALLQKKCHYMHMNSAMRRRSGLGDVCLQFYYSFLPVWSL